jgi:opacity protein-like surface antigen
MLKAAALGAAIVSLSSVAEAQNVLTQGLSLGLDASYASVKLEGDIEESETGYGLGLRVGYGVNRMWQPYLNYGRTSFDVEGGDATLGSIDLGTRVNFPLAGKTWVPFADVAYNIRTATLDDGVDEMDLDGSSFTLGGGVQWFLNSAWSLDGGLQYQIGGFDEAEMGGATADVDVDANTLRLNFGFSWRPMAR